MEFLAGIDGEMPPSYTEAITNLRSGGSSSFTSGSHAGPSSFNGTITNNNNDNNNNNNSHNNNDVLLPPSLTSSLTSPLTNHLRTLPARLHRAQQARATEQASRELDIITALIPHVENFLNNLGHHPSNTAELVLVPEAAVPKGWVMTGAAERRKEGEVVKIVKANLGKLVSEHTAGSTSSGKGEKSGLSSYEEDDDGDSPKQETAEFDEWGRFECADTDGMGSSDTSQWLWFKDEGMARRLATYLRPEPNLDRKHVQAVVVEKKAEKSGWRGWGSKKKGSGSSDVSLPTPSSPAVAEDEDAVKMTVRAKEITFRKENDFGLWESRAGFGIVCNVRISAR